MGKVDHLIFNELEPFSEEKRTIRETIKTITEFMQLRSGLTISKPYPAGSFEKNTMIRGRGEVDIVYYLSPGSTEGWLGADFRRSLRQVFKQSQKYLPGSKQHRRKFRAIRLLFKGLEADILLGLETITPQSIRNQDASIKAYIRPSVALYQVEWWRERGENYHQQLNHLVWLAKHWVARKKGRKLCSSYALELMVIHACEDFLAEENYEELFTRLVRWIVNTRLSGKYYFRKYYQEDVLTHYPLNRLNLWDPADPTNNIATRYNGLSNKRGMAFVEYAEDALSRIEKNNWDFL
ncbi:MAG: hypothetical protein ACE5OZ_18425 [Candidatus Heimdallarchaeota archaeon]